MMKKRETQGEITGQEMDVISKQGLHTYSLTEVANIINALGGIINDWAVAKGFYTKPYNLGEKIALMHSELSEALEGVRHGNPASDKIPEFSALEEEFADTIIRILDTAAHEGLDVGRAIFAKMAVNAGRPYMHGKEF